MACLPETKIQEYAAGDLGSIEAKYVQNHLLSCDSCRKLAERCGLLEKNLRHPVWLEPPETIIQHVMRRLYPPPIPLYSSIAALILAAVLFLVSWIYIYFNFANNSLIQAMHLTSKSTSNWLYKILTTIETLFTMIQATFKAISYFIHTLLNIHVNPNVIGGTFLTFSLIFLYFLLNVFARAIRGQRK